MLHELPCRKYQADFEGHVLDWPKGYKTLMSINAHTSRMEMLLGDVDKSMSLGSSKHVLSINHRMLAHYTSTYILLCGHCPSPTFISILSTLPHPLISPMLRFFNTSPQISSLPLQMPNLRLPPAIAKGHEHRPGKQRYEG